MCGGFGLIIDRLQLLDRFSYFFIFFNEVDTEGMLLFFFAVQVVGNNIRVAKRGILVLIEVDVNDMIRTGRIIAAVGSLGVYLLRPGSPGARLYFLSAGERRTKLPSPR